VGLAELALDTPDAYRCAITALALDPALLAGYRQHLVQQRLTLPLFDSQRYTQEMQTLLGRMAQRWRAGLGPAHLLSLDAA
jgi:predicted O-linked N-acetylglucosamine transferase (SPINDLY family)